MSPTTGAGPGDRLPSQGLAELEECSDRELHAVVDYAQALLQERHDPTRSIEAREGEEILRTDEHDGYTVVIVRRTDGALGDEGPFAYRVSYEPDVDGGEGRFRWHYLGRVAD